MEFNNNINDSSEQYDVLSPAKKKKKYSHTINYELNNTINNVINSEINDVINNKISYEICDKIINNEVIDETNNKIYNIEIIEDILILQCLSQNMFVTDILTFSDDDLTNSSSCNINRSPTPIPFDDIEMF